MGTCRHEILVEQESERVRERKCDKALSDLTKCHCNPVALLF